LVQKEIGIDEDDKKDEIDEIEEVKSCSFQKNIKPRA